jgi:glucose-1-phosphate cytidylyltransferase
LPYDPVVDNTIKVVILAGGLGTRIAEETSDKPKPMTMIGNKPILWHLMNSFALQGFDNFILALGYRGDVIKRWLLDLNQLSGDINIDTSSREITHLQNLNSIAWSVTALETGLTTQTGGRVAKAMDKFPGESVIVTYGDGLANVDIRELLKFHRAHGKLATVTAVRPPVRFGHLDIQNNKVVRFGEKFQSDVGWINGGFFVFEPQIMNYIKGDAEPLETGALPRLVKDNQLMAFEHPGFWQPMDTLREKIELTKLAEQIPPPWLKLEG